MPHVVDIARIVEASHFIDPAFLGSRVLQSEQVDAALGCRLLAKLETENPVRSFKGRGTDWFARGLRRREALVCASAGNFGLGLARAAQEHGHTCTVFVAETANAVKVDAIRRMGADIRHVGADFDAAKDAARRHARAHGLHWVEDGVEPAIAEGAGTIALEFADAGAIDAILIPLGNGALLAGIGTVFRQLSPRTRIVAVVAERAPAMQRSLAAGCAIETETAHTIADGIAVRTPIGATLALLRTCCDEVIAVSDAAIFEAMQLLHRYFGIVVEPAGAVGVAALMADPRRHSGQRVATILSGGNISADLRDQLLGPG